MTEIFLTTALVIGMTTVCIEALWTLKQQRIAPHGTAQLIQIHQDWWKEVIASV